MAGFTDTISSPGAVTGSVPLQDSTAAAIGSAFEGASKILDVGLKASTENRRDNLLNGLDKQLEADAQAFGTALGEVDPADASPTVQGAVSDVQRLSSAHKQGRMSRSDFFARASARVQQAVNENPRFADDIRKRAQGILGINPTAELVALEADAQKTKQAQADATQQALVGEAVKRGLGHMNPDGTINIPQTVSDAHTVLGAEYKMQEMQKSVQLQISQLELDAKKNPQKALTLTERQDVEARAVLGAANPVFASQLQGALSRLPALFRANANLKVPEQEAYLGQEIGRQKATFMGWLNGQLNTMDLSPESAQKVRDYYDNQFKPYEELVKGGFSNFETQTRALGQMKLKAGLDFHEAAPTLAFLVDAFGPQAGASIVSTGTSVGTALRSATDKDFVRISEYAATGVKPGAMPITQAVPDPSERRKVTQMLGGAVKDFTARAGSLEPKELSAFGGSLNQMTNVALEANDPADLVAATKNYTASPSVLALFDTYAADKNNKGNAQGLARKMMAVNQNMINLNGKLLKEYVQPTVSTINTGVDAVAVPTGSTTFSPIYNPETGMVEINSKGTKANLGDSNINIPLGTAPNEMVERVKAINQALDANVRLKNYGNDRDRSLSDSELKMMIAQGAGLQMKQTEMPKKAENKGSNLDFAAGFPSQKPMKALGLSKQETALYKHHIDNLTTGNASTNEDGSVSTLYTATFDVEGKTYVIPTVWDGKILNPNEALLRAKSVGLDQWPSYKSSKEADKRYNRMHDLIAKDVDPEEFRTNSTLQLEVVD